MTAARARRALSGLAAALLAAPLLLTGCATPSRPGAAPASPADTLSGRLSVRVAAHAGHAERGSTVAFELRGTPAAGELDLSTPLGSIVAQARWTPGEARLVTPQGERQYRDLDSLSRDALGETVPLAAMFDWLRGRPWPGAASRPEAEGFSQLGWTVDTRQQADGRITARRASPPEVTVRAALAQP